jgi:hypothetical protein
MPFSNPFGTKRIFKLPGSNQNSPQKKRFFTAVITVIALLISGVVINQGISRADSNTAFVYYIDAPLVQNSYLWTQFENSPSTHIASFNNSPQNSDCSFDNFSGASITNNPGGSCFTDNSTNWGGSTTLSSNPSTGGYANSTWDNTFMHGVISGTGATINFDQPQRYFGIWWSAGSYGNQLKFYSGDQIVGSTSADEVMSRLSNSGSSFTSGGGDSFSHDLYYGHPASYSPVEIDDYNQISEITDLSILENAANFSKGILDPNEPFTYIHFFTDNNVTFDRVVMSAPGNGFEFDNIVVSSETNLLSNLNSRLIQQGTVLLPNEVQFDPNAAQGGLGSMAPQFSATPTSLNWNEFSNPFPWLMFNGWNTELDGSGTSYDQGAEFPFANNTTLYAQWGPNPYWYTEFRFAKDNDWQYVPSRTPSITVSANEDLILPEPEPRPGFRFVGWTYEYWDMNENVVTGILGAPGDHITPSMYLPIIYAYWLYETWVPDNVPNPVIGASSSTIPVDPRITEASIPSLPVDTDSFNLCVTEVTDASGIQEVAGSDLTFSNSTSSGATGPITISGTSPITANGSRFIRIKVADTSFRDCQYGNSITVELSQLQLGGSNTVTVPIGRQ